MNIAVLDHAVNIRNYLDKKRIHPNLKDGEVCFLQFEQGYQRVEPCYWDIIFVSVHIRNLPREQQVKFLGAIKTHAKTVLFYEPNMVIHGAYPSDVCVDHVFNANVTCDLRLHGKEKHED